MKSKLSLTFTALLIFIFKSSSFAQAGNVFDTLNSPNAGSATFPYYYRFAQSFTTASTGDTTIRKLEFELRGASGNIAAYVPNESEAFAIFHPQFAVKIYADGGGQPPFLLGETATPIAQFTSPLYQNLFHYTLFGSVELEQSKTYWAVFGILPHDQPSTWFDLGVYFAQHGTGSGDWLQPSDDRSVSAFIDVPGGAWNSNPNPLQILISTVPEPNTLALTGVAGFLILAHRKLRS